jgi:F-type H+-transporting ATPase subunit b
MERLFGLDFQLIADALLMIIAVFILFLLMSYLLFNPARKLLNDRREKIRGDLENAAKDKEDAAALKAEYDSRLANVNKEAEEILSDARRRGLANENQIIAQAKEEASRIIERARVEAELEKQKMADEVKKEIVSVASLMAGKLVAASIDPAVQAQLIDETLKEMGECTWQN